MYRKRCQRPTKKENTNNKCDTPRTKTRKSLKHWSTKELKSTLTFQGAVIQTFRDQYEHRKESRKKAAFTSSVRIPAPKI